MSNSTTLLDLISSTQSNKEVVANALADAGSPATLWGRRASTTNGFTWGYYGGNFQVGSTSNAIANGTVSLASSATNYIYASATTGAVSVNQTGFPAGSVPLYTVVTGTTTVTSYTDQRSYQPSATASSASGTVTSVGAVGGVETDQSSGVAITGGGNIRTTMKLMNGAVQTAAYAMATGDRGTCLVMNSSSAVSQALPTPTGTTGSFPAGWWGEVANIGAGTTTMTVPSGLSLDGVTNGTLPLAQNTGVAYFTDGTNWYTLRGAASGGGGGSSTLAGLSDVNVTEGPGIDQQLFMWNNATSKWIAVAAKSIMTSFYPGVPVGGAVMLSAVTPTPVTLPSGLTGSYAYCNAGTTATAAVSLPINRVSSSGTVTNIGSVNFAIGATTGTFTFSSAVTTSAGDRIQVANQGTADTTFGNVDLCLFGTRPA